MTNPERNGGKEKMKKQKRRKEKGITLIALIITVVVLIILAGIGIGALVNQDGVVDKAKEAKLETEKKDIEEQINIMTIQSMDKYGNVIRETLKTKLEDLPEGKEIVDETSYIKVVYPEYEFKIDLNNGKVAEIVPVYVDNVLIPDGYVDSQVPGENTKAGGLVIYEGTVPVTEANHEQAMKTRNQYVWIPVGEINDMVMCESNTGDSVCDLVYDEETDTLTCQTHPATATNLVGRLYTSISNSIIEDGKHYYIIDFSKRDQTYDENSFHEPKNIVNDDDIKNNLTIDQSKSDFTAMAKSVAKNGGFYISRYEVGKNGESKKEQKVLTADDPVWVTEEDNYLGANTWYGLYNTIRKVEENKQMLWGCQCDQVIKFIGEEAQIGHSDRNLTTDHALSGQNELDKMKNIYDFEGNHNEWTAEERYTSNNRVFRGSDYVDAATDGSLPPSYRNYTYPTGKFDEYSSRSTLYL